VVGTLVAEGGEVPADPTPTSLRTEAATSLALFTAEGALRMLVRSHAKGIGPAWTVIRHAYDRWLFAQGLPAELVGRSWAGGGSSWPDGWLIAQHVLHRPVDGFPATVAALRSTTVPSLSGQREIEPRPNASDGAGAVVRAAPVGLLVPADVAFEAGVRTAAFTHGGPVGSLGPGIVARLVAELVEHGDLGRALDAAQEELPGWPHHGRVAGVVEAAMAGEAAAGKAGVAGRSLHAALRGVWTDAGDPLATMTDATHAGGTAAAIITGQLLGARLGHTAFAGRYRVALDVIGTIERLRGIEGMSTLGPYRDASRARRTMTMRACVTA